MNEALEFLTHPAVAAAWLGLLSVTVTEWHRHVKERNQKMPKTPKYTRTYMFGEDAAENPLQDLSDLLLGFSRDQLKWDKLESVHIVPSNGVSSGFDIRFVVRTWTGEEVMYRRLVSRSLIAELRAGRVDPTYILVSVKNEADEADAAVEYRNTAGQMLHRTYTTSGVVPGSEDAVPAAIQYDQQVQQEIYESVAENRSAFEKVGRGEYMTYSDQVMEVQRQLDHQTRLFKEQSKRGSIQRTDALEVARLEERVRELTAKLEELGVGQENGPGTPKQRRVRVARTS